MRLSGEGEAGARGTGRGDLYVQVRVKPHEFFERDGADLAATVTLSFAQAALGVAAEVPTLGGGRETLKIPPGTQPGAVFKLRGHGLPVLERRGTGDLYVKIEVRTPEGLSKEEKVLLREFAERRGEGLDRVDVAGPAKGRTPVH
jgi:molecular chaperone DnaJ